MNKEEFIHKTKTQLVIRYYQLWTDEGKREEDLGNLFTAFDGIREIDTVGEIFIFLANQCWDIPSTLAFILPVLIPDLLPGECDSVPVHWDT